MDVPIEISMVTIKPEEQSIYDAIRKEPRFMNINDMSLKILFNKGLKTGDEIYSFLYDNMNHLKDTTKMKDSLKFCEIVKEAIKYNWHIVNYTDYDMDGIGSCLTCTEGLNRIITKANSNAKVDWYANNRFIEGYGITPGGVDDLVSKYPDVKLIITTDNGIVAYDGVARAKELGIKVIVTDHHAARDIPTKADAIIDPKQKDCEYEFKELCGAGIMFKLILLLAWEMGFDIEEFYDLVDIVSLSTVADMVPVKGENRIIIKEGLKLIRKENRKFFSALREVLSEGESKGALIVNEELLGFIYCPMFNALSRLDGSIDLAIELMTTDDYEKMKEIARDIISNNDKRKEMQAEQTSLAHQMVLDMYPTYKDLPPVIVLHHETFHEGVVGLIASTIKDAYYRPTVVFSKAEKYRNVNGVTEKYYIYKGSARSIDGFDITDSFSKISNTILGFGGHAAAAGLSLELNKLEEFMLALNNYARPILTDYMVTKKIKVDAAIYINEITQDMIDELDMIRPYGKGFEKPNFGLKDFKVDVSRLPNGFYCGKNLETVRLQNEDGFTVIMFKHPEAFRKIEYKVENNEFIKPIGYPSVNIFRDNVYLQLQVSNDYIF